MLIKCKKNNFVTYTFFLTSVYNKRSKSNKNIYFLQITIYVKATSLINSYHNDCPHSMNREVANPFEPPVSNYRIKYMIVYV